LTSKALEVITLDVFAKKGWQSYTSNFDSLVKISRKLLKKEEVYKVDSERP